MRRFFLFPLLLLCALAARAQDPAPPSDPPGPASSGQPNAGPDSAGATDSGDSSPAPKRLTIFGEAFGRTHFSGELSFRQEYDDNVLASSLFRFSDNVSRLAARVSMASEGRRHHFQLHYSPEGRLYARFPQRDGFSQSYAHALDYSLGPHTSLRWTATVMDSSTSANSAFGFANFNGSIVPIFFPQGLENSLRVVNSRSDILLEHRSSARSTWRLGVNGGTANFFELNGAQPSSSRANEHFEVGSVAGWNYAINRAVHVGVELSQSYFGFLSPSSHLNYQTAKLTYEQRFRNGFSLRLGGGPSVQERQSAGNEPVVGFAADASLTKQFQRSSVGLQFRHGTQLGLAQGSIGTDQAAISVNRSIGRKWLAGGSFSYSRTEGLAGPSANGAFNSYGVNTSLGYQLTRTLRAQAGYWFTQQSGKAGPLALNNYDRNVYSLSLVYTLNSLFKD